VKKVPAIQTAAAAAMRRKRRQDIEPLKNKIVAAIAVKEY
jgi:hypothetical protein